MATLVNNNNTIALITWSTITDMMHTGNMGYDASITNNIRLMI